MSATHILLPEALVEHPNLIMQLVRPDTKIEQKTVRMFCRTLVQDIMLREDAEAFWVSRDVYREIVRLPMQFKIKSFNVKADSHTSQASLKHPNSTNAPRAPALRPS